MQANKLIFGLLLIAVGTLAFLGSIDVIPVHHIGRYWPLILIAIGVGGELEAIHKRKGDGSFILLAVGCWMLAGTFHLFDLSIRGAMPIGVVVAGVFVILHALIDRPAVSAANQSQEKNNVC